MTKSVQYFPIWLGLYTFWGFEVFIQTSYAQASKTTLGYHNDF